MAASIDLRATIAEHPWKAIAMALAAGAWLAVEQVRPPRSAIVRSVLASVGGLTFGIARDIATRRLLGYAREWLGDQMRAPAP
jgi:hypothetical protein